MAKQDLVQHIDAIIRFHPAIRFAVLAEKNGTILDAVKRAGVEAMEPRGETGPITERYAGIYELVQGSDPYFGTAHMLIFAREKLIEMVIPTPADLVIITAHPSFPLDKAASLERLAMSISRG